MKTKLITTGMLLFALAALSGCDEPDYSHEGLDFDIDRDLQTAMEKNQMPVLASRLNCIACHSLEHKVVGPAWKDIGLRYQNAATYEYKGKTYPLVEGLVMKVSHGGGGNWGEYEMPGIDPSGAKHELVEKLVRFILAQGKR